MPSLPPGITEWLPSGLFTVLLGLVWYEVRASEARLNKRIDELREDNRELSRKLDRLMESRLPTPQ